VKPAESDEEKAIPNGDVEANDPLESMINTFEQMFFKSWNRLICAACLIPLSTP
jgi:hypothetical protein